MSVKRPCHDLDPDYEDVSDQQQKRQKILEDDAKETTVRKITGIIKKHFHIELQNKDAEINFIDQRLHEARHMLDRLRACIVANYYSRAGQLSGQMKSNPNQPPIIHPAVKPYLGKTVPHDVMVVPPSEHANHQTNGHETKMYGRLGNTEDTKQGTEINKTVPVDSRSCTPKSQPDADTQSQGQQIQDHASKGQGHSSSSRFKVKKRIVVGSVSKYIPLDKRDDNDQATHKWMVYVRGAREEPKINHFVDKVWFFLHPSYKPNDLVEINQSPFHLTRRGWGEFPIRIQLHFSDSRNKRVDIIHQLKLDKTYTGLQTLGSETHVDVELDRVTVAPPSQEVRKQSSGLGHLQRTSTPTPAAEHQSKEISNSNKSSFKIGSGRAERPTNISAAMDLHHEQDSENSLGIVWAHDQGKLDEHKRLPVDFFESSTAGAHRQRGIMGDGDVLLSSGAFKDLQAIASSRTTNAPNPSAILPPTRIPNNPRSRTPSKLQISRSLTPQGWTRLQIKQEDGDSQSTSSSLSTSKTPEIKEEPLDDSYHRPPSRQSTPRTPHKQDSGFHPVGNESSGSGWTHVQIKSEPVTPDRPTSACSGRTDLRSISTTPDKSESQPSLPPSPATPDRVVRFELGRTMSPGIKLNVADTKNMLHLQRQGNQQNGAAPRTEGTDFPSWKQTQGKQQSLTLGMGLAQLSATSQNLIDSGTGKGLNLKNMLVQEKSPAPPAPAASPTVPAKVLTETGTKSDSKQSPPQDNVYVQCMDASGKVFLIPQQMIKSQTSASQLQAKGQGEAKDISPQTIVVGSGPTKATLTYTMSPQGSPNSTESKTSSNPSPVVTQEKKPVRPPVPLVAMTSGGQVQGQGHSQKLLLIPSSVGPQQVAVASQAKTGSQAKSPAARSLVSPQQQPVLIRDQAGNVQFVQMASPMSATGEKPVPSLTGNTEHTQTVKGSSSTVQTTPTSVGKNARQLSSAASEASPASKDGSVRLQLPGSPHKSIVIPKETLGHLQPGQLLQIQIPPKAPGQSGTLPPGVQLQGSNTQGQRSGVVQPSVKAGSVVTGTPAAHPVASASSKLMVIAGKSQNHLNNNTGNLNANDPQGSGKVSALKANQPKGVTISGAGLKPPGTLLKPGQLCGKPQGTISLLRPGLIVNKIATSAAIANVGPSAPHMSDARENVQVDSETRSVSRLANNGAVLAHAQNLLTNQKPQPKGQQPLLKSASNENLSLLQKVPGCKADSSKKNVSAVTGTGTATQPLYLTTKIGNQTVLLKIEQPMGAGGGGTKLPNVPPQTKLGLPKKESASEASGIMVVKPANGSAAPAMDNLSSTASQKGAAPATGVTIKHGSILGIGRVKEEIRQDVTLDVNIDSYPDIPTVLMSLVRRFPLVREEVDRSLHPYCARSAEDFCQWNVGKRRAAEWQRACRVRKKLISAIEGSTNFRDAKIWTTREIVIWCRQHYFTPLDQEISKKLSRTHSRGQQRAFSSFTIHQDVLQQLSQYTNESPGVSSDDEDIDIIELSSPKRLAVKSELTGSGDEAIPTDVIPSSPLGDYVRGTASQVGVHLKPTPVTMGDASVVLASLSEEVIISSLKLFVDQIIRTSTASQYKEKRYPGQLESDDVYRALRSLPRCDFLTNVHLGTRAHNLSCSPLVNRNNTTQ